MKIPRSSHPHKHTQRTLAVGAVVLEDGVEDVDALGVVGKNGAAAPSVVVGPVDAAGDDGGAVHDEDGAADEALLVAATVDEGHLVRVQHRLVVEGQVALARGGADGSAGVALEVELEGVREDELALQLVRLALDEANAAEAALLVLLLELLAVVVAMLAIVDVGGPGAEPGLLSGGRARVVKLAVAAAAKVVALLRLVLQDGQRTVLCVCAWACRGVRSCVGISNHTTHTDPSIHRPTRTHKQPSSLPVHPPHNALTSSVELWTMKGLNRTSRARKRRWRSLP